MKTTYNIFTDPGHGWLEVEISELKRLNIFDKITSYSYLKKDKAYLEEDCDLTLFMEEKQKRGETVSFNEIYQNITPIRNYQHFPEPKVNIWEERFKRNA